MRNPLNVWLSTLFVCASTLTPAIASTEVRYEAQFDTFQSLLNSGAPSPFSSLAISLTYSADSLTAPISRLTSLTFSLGTKLFLLDEVGVREPQGNSINTVGALSYEVWGMASGTDDFTLIFDANYLSQSLLMFSTVSQPFDLWASYSPSSVSVSVVPEVSSSSLLTLGALFLLGVLRKRHKAP